MTTGAQADRANQLDNVNDGRRARRAAGQHDGVRRSGLRSSPRDLIVDAFKDAQAGSFKDVVVLFIGEQADLDNVKQALAASGADVRFVEAK